MKPSIWKPKKTDPVNEFFNFDHPFFQLSDFPGFSSHRNGSSWFPAIDISEDAKEIHLKADLPGLKKEDIQLSVDGTVLTIKGTRNYENEKKEKDFHRIERSYGSFQRSVDLGVTVSAEDIKAKYEHGVLDLKVPKSEVVQKQQIRIE